LSVGGGLIVEDRAYKNHVEQVADQGFDRHTPPLDARQSQSGQGSGARLQRCEAGRFAGCMALAVERLKESKTGTTGTARDLRKRSRFGS
jgi:hypothetical protein